MKKITAISILFAFSKIVFGQKDSVVIHQVIVDYFEAISANDLGKQKELTTADYLLLENGAIWNQDTIEIKTNQLKGLSIQRINKIAFIRTYVQDNIAWVAYYNT